MTDATNEGLEEIVLDCEAAKALAKKFRNEADPFTEIPPSLLSAKHIGDVPISVEIRGAGIAG